MIISLSPRYMKESLSVVRRGDVLTVNGADFDFSQLLEGAVLPAEAIDSAWFAGVVTRVGGEIRLTLRLPHGANPTQSTAFPVPIHVLEDGPIALPTDEVPA